MLNQRSSEEPPQHGTQMYEQLPPKKLPSFDAEVTFFQSAMYFCI